MNLPDDGDLVVFDELPAGSLLRKGVVYRVERKPMDREFLLIDTAAGHAGRVSPTDIGVAKWHVATEADRKPKVTAAESPAGKPKVDVLGLGSV